MPKREAMTVGKPANEPQIFMVARLTKAETRHGMKNTLHHQRDLHLPMRNIASVGLCENFNVREKRVARRVENPNGAKTLLVRFGHGHLACRRGLLMSHVLP